MKKTPFKTWWESIPLEERDARLDTLLYKLHRKIYIPFKYVEDISEEKFLALRNAGKMSWSILQELISKYHNAPPYSEEDKELTMGFVREIEMMVQCWNEHGNDDLYEKSRDEKVNEYLTKILKG